MEERERIIEVLRESADEEELERCIELLDTAISGLEQGMAAEAERKVKEVLVGLTGELDEAAEVLEKMIKE